MKDVSTTPIPSPGRRAASYWFADGLPDIVFRMTLLVFGAAGLWWRVHLSKPTAQFDFFFISAGSLLLLWKGREILDSLKARVTYPRTGYVQPPEDLSEGIPPSAPITMSLRPAPPPDENVTISTRAR